jgi:hypothetical protein
MNQGDTAGQGAAPVQDATTGGQHSKGERSGTRRHATCVPGQPNCPTDAGAADANAPSADGQDTTTEQTGETDAGAAEQGADQQGDARQQGHDGEPAPATAPAEITPQHTKSFAKGSSSAVITRA